MSRSARQSHSSVLKEVVKQTESDLDEEFKQRLSQAETPLGPNFQDIVKLRTELNKQVEKCEKKQAIVTMLRYSTELNRWEGEEERVEEVMERMQVDIESANRRIIQEEQNTEVLKAMLEKVTTGQSIMKQRAKEVQQVLMRVRYQLAQASHMKVLANGFLGIASTETASVRCELTRERTRFSERISRKQQDKAFIERLSRQKIERIGLAALAKDLAMQKRRVLVSNLEEEMKRHVQEVEKMERVRRDIEGYREGFRVISEILGRRKVEVEWETGVQQGTVESIVKEYSEMAVQEASLSSRYQQLTWDLSSSKSLLKSLKHLLHTPHFLLSSPCLSSLSALPEDEVNHLEHLSISLHSALLSLLTSIEVTHERVSGNLPDIDSPDRLNWRLLRDLTKGYRLNHRSRITTEYSPDGGHHQRRRSFTHITARKLSIPDPTSNESWAKIYGLLLTSAELRSCAEECQLDDKTCEEVETFWRKTLVVSYFMDRNILRSALKAQGNLRVTYLELIDKTNQALRFSVKDLCAYAKEALSCFISTNSHLEAYIHDLLTKNHAKIAANSAISQEHELNSDRKLEEIMRNRYISLLRSASEEPNPSIRFDKRRSVSNKRVNNPIDSEEAENRLIIETRNKVKMGVFTVPTVLKRVESMKTAKLMEDPPKIERAKRLLRGFLSTEKRISEIKDTERVTMKELEGHEAPLVRRFQGGLVPVYSRSSTASTKHTGRAATTSRGRQVRSGSEKLFPTNLKY